MNIKFLVITYFVSLFVDWMFQLDWQAVNKSKWEKNDDKLLSFFALFTHSAIYSLATVLIIALLNVISGYVVWIVIATLFISHFIIDSRILVKWIMRFQGKTIEQINNYRDYGFLHIGIDHRLHELIILILACFIK